LAVPADGAKLQHFLVRIIGHWLQYVALRAVVLVATLVPQQALCRALERLALVVMRLDPRHRCIVSDNLAIAFPEWAPERRAEVTARAFANWGRLAGELAHVDKILAEPRSESLLELDRRIDESLEAGRGLLILSGHTANFELLARLASRPKRRILLFHRQMSNDLVDRHLTRERARAGLGTLGRGASVREAIRILARGGIIVAPMDQNQPPGRGIFVELFGRPASTSTFLARLSMVSGAPVLPIFAVWEGQALLARIGDTIDAPRDVSDHSATARALTERYTREIEMAVRAYPEQWNWAHRRWKTRPPEEGLSAGITRTSVELNESEARSSG
jgi:KDO2-lipid IV(A) lauroyltransferase